MIGHLQAHLTAIARVQNRAAAQDGLQRPAAGQLRAHAVGFGGLALFGNERRAAFAAVSDHARQRVAGVRRRGLSRWRGVICRAQATGHGLRVKRGQAGRGCGGRSGRGAAGSVQRPVQRAASGQRPQQQRGQGGGESVQRRACHQEKYGDRRVALLNRGKDMRRLSLSALLMAACPPSVHGLLF